MRYVGRITEWNDQKGYGFVLPDGGGARAFVHIRAFGRHSRRPIPGELISYVLKRDERGRCNAGSVQFVGKGTKGAPAPGGAWPRTTIGALFLAALVLAWLLGNVPPLLPLVYCAMSAIAVLLYGVDKTAAVNNRWRVQESTLHIAGLLCGWPGALFAQDVFRHKSRKVSFQVVFLSTVMLNLAALVWLHAYGIAGVIGQGVFHR